MIDYKVISRITGVGYLLIFVTGFFANFYILEGLVVDNDAAQTTANITAHHGQFILGLLAFTLMVFIDLMLAIPLYKLLEPVSKRQSVIASVLRIVNAIIFGVALIELFHIDFLVAQPLQSKASLAAEIMQLVDSFNQVWMVGLIFFGLHLLLLGHLVRRAGYFPKVIGMLLQVAAISYLADSIAQLFMPNYELYGEALQGIVILGGVAGEFSLTVWLLLRGVDPVKVVASANDTGEETIRHSKLRSESSKAI